MMETIKIICYVMFAYGISNIIVYGSGPLNIIHYFRLLLSKIHSNLGELVNCMMCLSANIGILFSLLDLFVITSINITPFNIIINDIDLWWLIIIMDLGLTSGTTWFIYQIDNFLYKYKDNG